MTGFPADILSCPQCGAEALAPGDGASALACKACTTRFPAIDGIPWLVADPEAILGEWRDRLHRLVLELQKDAERVRAELEGKGLRTATRSRLKLLAGAYGDHARRLQALLSPLSIADKQIALETHLALRTGLPPGQDLTSYYVNLHRDWVWGEEENESSAALNADLLAGKPPGRMLVLGAGACRLAYDLHRGLHPELTVAADINPLLLLATRRILCGEPVSLYEFPIAPRRLEDHAILRRLAAPEAVDGNFHLVFADALQAPFREGRFDTVLTPWLVDIISADLAALAPRINRLLKPGGRWINFGSLAFSHREAALCYTLEEALEVVADSGFECIGQRETSMPYMRSPASRHARMESVVAFAAAKRAAVAQPMAHRHMPEWLQDEGQVVPLLPQFRMTAAATRIHAFVMSLIDGQRSARDIAGVLVAQRLMMAEEAGPAVRAFLLRMYEDARQQ